MMATRSPPTVLMPYDLPVIALTGKPEPVTAWLIATDGPGPGKDVRCKQRVVCDLCESLDRLPSVIEFVIADAGHVEPHQVSDLIDRLSVENGRNRSSPDQVAGVEIQAGRAVFALMTDSGGEVGESTAAHIIREQMRVEIVRMKDGEMADVLRPQRGEEQE